MDKCKDGKASDQESDIRGILERILATLEQLVKSDQEVHAALKRPEPQPEDALDELVIELESPEEREEEEVGSGVEDAT